MSKSSSTDIPKPPLAYHLRIKHRREIVAAQPPSLTSPPNLPECISHPCRSRSENRREIRISLISGTLSVYACIPVNVNAMTAVVLASRGAERAAALIRRLGQVGWLELSC